MFTDADFIKNVPRGEWRFQTALSALDGLTIQQARDFLYGVMDHLDEQKVTSGAADTPTDVALLNLAAALGAKY